MVSAAEVTFKRHSRSPAIIIIIIKKVEIIVTLSIKNTAGALYKSQIKGENRYCLWLRNSNVFRRRRKQSSDGNVTF